MASVGFYSVYIFFYGWASGWAGSAAFGGAGGAGGGGTALLITFLTLSVVVLICFWISAAVTLYPSCFGVVERALDVDVTSC